MLSDAAQKLFPEDGGYAARVDIDPPAGNPDVGKLKAMPVDYDEVEKETGAREAPVQRNLPVSARHRNQDEQDRHGRIGRSHDQRPGTLDHEERSSRRRAPVPVGEMRRRSGAHQAARSCSCTAPRWPRSRHSTCRCPGRPDSSVMDFFAARGYDTWCVDMEGYGRSDKDRDNNAPIAHGRRRLQGRRPTISARLRGDAPVPRLWHLIGRVARGHVRRAQSGSWSERLALDAMVWTGEGSPDTRRAQAKASRIPAQEPPPDRQGFRLFDLQPRSSGHRRGPRDRSLRRRHPRRSTIRCRPEPMSTCARICRWWTRERSRCRPSSCAASGTASRVSTI